MKKTDNRENILNIALKLFSDKGYHSVGIQEIVDMAEVTKPTLYHYYGNKKGLLECILKKYYLEMIEELKKASDKDEDIIKILTNIIKEYFLYCKNNKDFFYFQLSLIFVPSSNELNEVIKPYHIKFNNLIIDILKRTLWTHGDLKNNQDILARTLTGILNFYALGIIDGSFELNEELIHKVVKQYMYGIYSL